MWWCGGVVVHRCGGVVVYRCGGVVVHRCSGVVVWWLCTVVHTLKLPYKDLIKRCNTSKNLIQVAFVHQH